MIHGCQEKKNEQENQNTGSERCRAMRSEGDQHNGDTNEESLGQYQNLCGIGPFREKAPLMHQASKT